MTTLIKSITNFVTQRFLVPEKVVDTIIYEKQLVEKQANPQQQNIANIVEALDVFKGVLENQGGFVFQMVPKIYTRRVPEHIEVKIVNRIFNTDYGNYNYNVFLYGEVAGNIRPENYLIGDCPFIYGYCSNIRGHCRTDII
jgi:hypothetical protein